MPTKIYLDRANESANVKSPRDRDRNEGYEFRERWEREKIYGRSVKMEWAIEVEERKGRKGDGGSGMEESAMW